MDEKDIGQILQEEKKRQRRGLVFLIIIIAGVLIYNTFFAGDGLSVSVGEEYIQITTPEGTTRDVPYDGISSVALEEDTDLGAAADGEAGTKYSYGYWENDIWGDYELYVKNKVKTYIVVTEKDGSIIVFNVDNETTTEAFYEAFVEFLEDF